MHEEPRGDDPRVHHKRLQIDLIPNLHRKGFWAHQVCTLMAGTHLEQIQPLQLSPVQQPLQRYQEMRTLHIQLGPPWTAKEWPKPVHRMAPKVICGVQVLILYEHSRASDFFCIQQQGSLLVAPSVARQGTDSDLYLQRALT